MPHIVSPALAAVREQTRSAWRTPEKIGGKDNKDKIPWPTPAQNAVEAICEAVATEQMWLGTDEFRGEPLFMAERSFAHLPAYNATNILVATNIACLNQHGNRTLTQKEVAKAMEELSPANGFNPMRDRFRWLGDNWDGKRGGSARWWTNASAGSRTSRGDWVFFIGGRLCQK